MRTVTLLSLLALSACGSNALRGNADLRLADLIVTRTATPASVLPLLADDATVHRAEAPDTVKGAAQAAAQLAEIVPGAKTRVMRHHDVSVLMLDDGRVLFMQRSEADRVTRAVELRGPMPGDGRSWQNLYYDQAWNLDDDTGRLALLRAAWAADGRYVDPTNDHRDPAAISNMIGVIRKIFIGTQVVALTGSADNGDGWFTFDWEMRSRLGGRVIFRGFDIVHVTPTGEFELLAGFPGYRAP
ncbi:MAG: hypothetical protein IPJ65_23070 [Archangiaceae bacterium]|nr:hypothetical protein [Archangiaceae bacterium]